MSSARVLELVTISKVNNETILSIVSRLELLIHHFEKNKTYSSHLPLLSFQVTLLKQFIDKLKHTHYFNDKKKIERLIVYQTCSYLTTLKTFLETDLPVAPWSAYYNYCKKRTWKKEIQLLLGINASTNADLFEALSMNQIPSQHDFSLLFPLLQESFHKEGLSESISKIVIAWYKQTYKNAKKNSEESSYPEIIQQTESLGNLLQKEYVKLFSTPSRINESKLLVKT